MSDFDLNDMVDFFAKEKDVNVLVFDEEGVHEVKEETRRMSKEWFVLECVVCSKVASWYDLEGDSYCDRCKEDWPNE